MADATLLIEPGALEASHSGLEIDILGPFQVRIGRDPVRLRPMQRLVLVALLFADGHTLTSSRLERLLWDREPDHRTAQTLRTYISQLRGAFSGSGTVLAGTEVLETIRIGGQSAYQLYVGPRHVDAIRFEQLATAGCAALQAARYAEAAGLLGQAEALWRGEALSGVAERPFARPRIDRLASVRRITNTGRMEACICLGRYREVISELEELCVIHGDDGWLWCLLIVSFCLADRHADAARACRTAIEAIMDVGLDDSQLMQLQARVLNRTVPRDGALALKAARSA